MESTKIEVLLESYFEGQTSLLEEAVLREYFAGKDVASDHLVYKPLFIGFQEARNETSQREVILPKNSKSNRNWWYGIAALLVVSLSVGGFLFSEPQLSAEEREALAAFEKAKKTMMILSENLNKGTQELAYIDQFTKGTSLITQINQFTNTKNEILK